MSTLPRGAAAIRYRLVPARPEAHLYEVSCTVLRPDPEGQRFALPVWIPGSYLVRDFARHVVSIRARSGRREVPLIKLDNNTWQAAPCDGVLTVTMEVYAWDLSVRGAHLDTTHGFFNGTSVFLRVVGQESQRCEVELVRPRGRRYAAWRVATAMRRKQARAYDFGLYQAADYDELIDHPVEMGTFTLATFKARGVPHDIAITGRHEADMDRLCRDLKRLCEWQIDFWGVAPMDRYVFLVTAVGEGYGGLEHRASTALLCSRDDLPRAGLRGTDEAYRNFLGLCSHEYFHTWNVKRLKPAAFTPYDLDRENHTTLLWAFEGITSYYDDLALVRCGLITPAQYLETIGRTATQLLRNGGRHKQTISESSWDAWTKFYRPDENTPNAVVSYYGKGSLVALCLDSLIRERTRGRKSLDDVMRALWQRYGETGEGVPEDGVERMAEEVAGTRMRAFFDRALRSTAELPLRERFAALGVDMALRPAESSADRGGKPSTKSAKALAACGSLGAKTANAGADVKLAHVYDGGAAQAAGLSAGDVLVAIDGLRVTGKNVEKMLARRQPGTVLNVHAFRRDELHSFKVTLQAPPADTCVLQFAPRRNVSQRNWVDDRAEA
ncbi:MAG TPA: PDZ domain-containing protein [Burkholderiales bacterium]|nr:PDZ domain-containing protein [Burkholderiales bacterium]